MSATISVIIPAYNCQRYIREALESVLAQTHVADEIIVVDDGSDDETVNIVSNFVRECAQNDMQSAQPTTRPAIKLLSTERTGPAQARNTGVKACNGEFVAFLDADDIWFPTKLERQVAALSKQPEAEYVVCHAEWFLQEGSALPAGFRPELLETPRIARISDTLLVSRRFFDSINGFDATLADSEDIDWFVRARDRGFVGLSIDEVLVRIRVHQESYTASRANNANLLEVLSRSARRKRQAE